MGLGDTPVTLQYGFDNGVILEIVVPGEWFRRSPRSIFCGET
jgi:hypothetical protein